MSATICYHGCMQPTDSLSTDVADELEPSPAEVAPDIDAAVPPVGAEQAGQMSHRQVLEALTGLLLAMFVAILSSTIVSNALPRIVADLHGSQSGYTWVVVATLLTMTASTPIWGKLADQFDKKLLVQIGLSIFVIGSAIAGLSQSMGMLIAARAVQGLGVGGMTALVQVVIASMIAPRDRGRYSGYIGAVFALATVIGPLVGGLIVDTPGLGWRWCFFVGLPVAVVAFGVIQKTLHLPVVRRKVSIDFLGAALLVGGISTLLIWVSLAGQHFAWASGTTAALVGLGALLLAAAVLVEMFVAEEPIIPIRLFRDRTTVLATVASVMVGFAMFGATVYLSQYFQISRGMTPTHAGLMSVAMVGGLLLSSITTGRIISSTGVWKRYLVGGATMILIGLLLLSTIDAHTPRIRVLAFMFVLGLGLGATMQNLVLAVQNNVAQKDIGAGSSLVAFFRSMGGSIGVSALGAVLASQVASKVQAGLAAMGVPAGGHQSHDIPNLRTLPAPIRSLFEGAFGEATGHLFLIGAPFALVALLCALAIREVPLRTTVERADEGAQSEGAQSEGAQIEGAESKEARVR